MQHRLPEEICGRAGCCALENLWSHEPDGAGKTNLPTSSPMVQWETRYWLGKMINHIQGEGFKIYSGLWRLSVSPRCRCVYTMAGQTDAAAAELAEFRKITTF